MKNKLISILLTVVLLVTLAGGSVFAATPSQQMNLDKLKKGVSLTVLKDTKDEKEVKVVEGSMEYIAVHDKVKNTITLNTYESNNLISSETTDLNNIQVVEPQMSVSSTQIANNSSLWTGSWDYWYYIYKETDPVRYQWSVWKEYNNKRVYESSANQSDLNGFKSAVDGLVTKQIECIAALGAAGASTVAAALTAPTGLGAVIAVLAALGFAATSAALFWSAYQYRQDCSYYYARI